MTGNQKREACKEFFKALAEELKGSYELVWSCNHDDSMYLIPVGTINELSYYGKPKMSFRMSDHWNWLSSTRKCKDRYHVQCNSADMPRALYRRHDDNTATRPRFGWQVAMYDNDGMYYAVFGEKYDRWNKEWDWITADPHEIAALILGN